MATISITRSNEYANRLRKIKLFVDGKEADTIANAETKAIELLPGSHTLQAKIDWCSSNELLFTISEKEVKQFSLDSFAKHSSLGILATIYYITIGAGKYLRLTEQPGNSPSRGIQ